MERSGAQPSRSPPSGQNRVFFAEGTHTPFCLIRSCLSLCGFTSGRRRSLPCLPRLSCRTVLVPEYGSMYCFVAFSTGDDYGGERSGAPRPVPRPAVPPRVYLAEGTRTLFCLLVSLLSFFVQFHERHEAPSALLAEDIYFLWDRCYYCTRVTRQHYCLLCTMHSYSCSLLARHFQRPLSTGQRRRPAPFPAPAPPPAQQTNPRILRCDVHMCINLCVARMVTSATPLIVDGISSHEGHNLCQHLSGVRSALSTLKASLLLMLLSH